MSTVKKKLLVSLTSTIVALPLLEIGLRVGGFDYPPAWVPPLIWNPKQDKKLDSDDYLFQHAVRQLWTPRPGASVEWSKKGERINEDGHRGPRLAFDKTAGVLRVATLGDSSTFGHSVEYDECYSGQLETMLDDSGLESEVLCGGVIGFRIRQGIERYKEFIRPYSPDIVVVAFGAYNEHVPGANGLDDRQLISMNTREDSATGRSIKKLRKETRIGHLAGYISDEIRGGRDELRQKTNQQKRETNKLNKTSGEADWPGVRKVGLNDFRESLDELCDMIERDGARPIVVSMPRTARLEKEKPILPRYTTVVEEFVADRGVEWVDAHTRFRERENETNKWREIFVDNVHPNPKGHGWIAEGLTKIIRGWYPNGKQGE